MKSVAIIMSTYNGEKYVKEQLRSLSTQTYESITVYIHDDCSSDNTESIIKKFIADNQSSVKFVYVGQEKYKYPQCFIQTLINVPQHDYYAFCDQDDVWFNDKIEIAVREIEKFENGNKDNIPILFYSAVQYYDENLNYMRSSRFKYDKPIKVCKFEEMILGGEAMGMTFLFNNEVRNIFSELVKKGAVDFKDTFIKIYCAACGIVIYSSNYCAKYRRHAGATTVGMNPAGNIQRIVKMLRKIFIDSNVLDSIKESVNYIYENFQDRVIPENLELLILFISPNGITKKMKKIFWKGRFRLKIIDEVAYRIAFLLGRI